MSRLVEFGLVVTIAGCGLVGAYQAGKLSERQRWRLELAAGDSRLERKVSEASVDVVGVDQQLLEGIRNDRERLAEAEAKLAQPSAQPPPSPQPAVAVGIAGTCQLVPAHCLRR